MILYKYTEFNFFVIIIIISKSVSSFFRVVSTVQRIVK